MKPAPSPTIIRPAGQGPTCDAWYRNPAPGGGPYLVRCRRQAAYRLTLATQTDCYQVKRCQAHRDELHAPGKTFEILAEEEL
jgi:hypothetical protein